MKLQAKLALTVIQATATLVEGADPPEGPNCDSNFLNMPPRELNTLDVTGLPLPRGGVCADVSLNPGSMRTMAELCS